MSRINSNEAPRGYYAVREVRLSDQGESHGCCGCAFTTAPCPTCGCIKDAHCNAIEPVACMGDDRKDGQNVIFLAKPAKNGKRANMVYQSTRPDNTTDKPPSNPPKP